MVGSIVSAVLFSTPPASAGDGLLQVAEVLARGLPSPLSLCWSHRDSGFDSSVRSEFCVSNNLVSVLCTSSSATKGSSARSSMGEPDGRLRIGTILDTPHSANERRPSFLCKGECWIRVMSLEIGAATSKNERLVVALQLNNNLSNSIQPEQ